MRKVTRMEAINWFELLGISKDSSIDEIYSAMENVGIDDLAELHYGMSKMCLTFEGADFVLKWTKADWEAECTGRAEQDEAVAEAHIYLAAKALGLEMFFPYTEIVGEFNDITLVLQEKVDVTADDALWSDDSEDFIDSIELQMPCTIEALSVKFAVNGARWNRNVDKYWGSLLINLYSAKIIDKLAKFIRDNEINDLHGNNLAYKNHKPVIMDFSGYYRS